MRTIGSKIKNTLFTTGKVTGKLRPLTLKMFRALRACNSDEIGKLYTDSNENPNLLIEKPEKKSYKLTLCICISTMFNKWRRAPFG